MFALGEPIQADVRAASSGGTQIVLTGSIGAWSIHSLLAIVIASFAVHTMAMVTKSTRWRTWSRLSMVAQFVVAVVASGALIRLLLVENFHYAYVADYTGPGLSLIYRIAAFWGGNAGSLLLWVLLLTLYGSVVVCSKHEDSQRMLPIVSLILSLVTLFYVILLNTQANPFVRLPYVAQANGLNPLLVNPGMTVHPVNVYLGYIGFVVPFAYAMAGLLLKKTDATWLKVTRRWTLISWLFLSIGIVYGAHWSYEELGWGGYWAWDPVENASLLPWLTSTAFLHSAIVQEKRGMLKAWNVILISVTFLLTVLGTFLTRSGVLWSIHAFANAPLGRAFLWFLGTLSLLALVVIVTRWSVLRADRKLEAVISKESGFLLNNVLFLSCTFAVLWGTIFPILSEAFIGRRMLVTGPFYNAVNLPLAVCIILLMGIGPVMAWRRATLKHIATNLLPLFLVAIVVGLGSAWLLRQTYHRTSVLGTFALIAAVFAICTVLREFIHAVYARCQLTHEHWSKSIVQLLAKNRRRYGGYIVHVAIAMMAIGIAGSGAYHVDVEAQLTPGQRVQVADYTITFAGLGVNKGAQSSLLYANLLVDHDGRALGVMRPSATFFNDANQPTTNVALYSGPMRDLYVVMLGTGSKGAAVFDLHVNPLVQFIWDGGYLFIAGTLVSLWPERLRRGKLATSAFSQRERSVYQDLAELEYDYKTRKIDVAEYQQMQTRLYATLADIDRSATELRKQLEQELVVEHVHSGGENA